MSRYQVSFTATAEKELAALPANIVARIFPRIERLAENPRPAGCKKLVGGRDEWRIRVGNYRIVYEIDDLVRTIAITRIAHRRDVYN